MCSSARNANIQKKNHTVKLLIYFWVFCMSIVIRAIIKLLFGILIFVGSPLLGWGIKDFREFLGDPARLSYAIIVVLLQIFIVIKLPEVGSDRVKGKRLSVDSGWRCCCSK
jgi:hypothetical protein